MRIRVAGQKLLIPAALSIYIVFALARLDLPGLNYDETLFVNGALGNLDGTFVDWGVRLGGRQIPLILMRYIGALKAWLYAPIFALFGTSVIAIRLPAVLIGLAALVFTYRAVRSMLGRPVALVTLALLAADPAFIFAVKPDWGPVALMMALKMSALYFAWRWLETGGVARLCLAALLLGLGLFDKITFLWFLCALAVALPLCFWAQLRARLCWKAALAALGCFLLGCWPLLAFNIVFPLRTLEKQKVITTGWGQAVPYRARVLRKTLDGSALHEIFNREQPGDFTHTLRRQTGHLFDDSVARLVGVLALEGTLNAVALIAALAGDQLVSAPEGLSRPGPCRILRAPRAGHHLLRVADRAGHGPAARRHGGSLHARADRGRHC